LTDGGALDRVLEYAAIRAGETVLDVPAGSLTFGALERVGDAWVITIHSSVGQLEELRRAARDAGAAGIQYLLGDADVLPLPDASVDVAIGCALLDSVDDVGRAAEELHRVLRAGGRVSLAERRSKRADLEAPFRGAGFEDVRVRVGEEREPGLALVTARRP